MRVFIGMETSGACRRAFSDRGHDVLSCDLLPATDGCGYDPIGMTGHYVGDVFECLDKLRWGQCWPDLAIFHPTCTYLTNSAEWAYKDPDFVRYPGVGYHQKLKPGTLFGAERRAAREAAKDQFKKISALPIARKVVENPRGALSQIRKVSQTVHPYQFGDDASKATCLWYIGKDGEDLTEEMLIPIDPAARFAGRIVFDSNLCRMVERWSNQTDKGQNNLPPSEGRWQARSETYPGIAAAMAKNWG